MPQVKLVLFGPPQLLVDEQPVRLTLRKAYALLAYLSVTGQPHSRDHLATLFWPEANQSTARSSLRRMIYGIGQRLACPLLEATPEIIGIASSAPLSVDVARFRQYVSIGLNGPPQLEQLELASKLYLDDFLAGFTLEDCFEFSEWQSYQREELRQTMAQVWQRLVEYRTNQEEYSEAITYARGWLTLDSTNEAAHQQLMRLYALSDQHTASIRQYHECVRILTDKLGVTPTDATTTLFNTIRTRQFPPSDTPLPPRSAETTASSVESLTSKPHPITSPPSHPALRHNLPPQSTPFIGREQELEEIYSRIHHPICRLLTLIGPGGIGKTRLSLEVGQRILAETGDEQGHVDGPIFRDGIFFAPLQPLATASDIPVAIANALDMQLYENRSARAQLLDFLADKALLLILDNFEHLLDANELLLDLMAAGPRIKLLVTSREALQLQESWFQGVTGMVYPPTTNASAQQGYEYDSVRLFEQCARRVQPGFSLANEYAHVLRICRLVEGMPLALELAAAWLKALPIAQVADEIARSLDILTTRHRNVPERHRSIRAVLMQTWEQLESQEQEALTKLVIFRGGFTRQAAAEVADASLLILASLVDKALLQRVEDERYLLHELLRQFAQEDQSQPKEDKASADIAFEQTTKRFCHYYMTLICQLEPELRGEMPQATLGKIRLDLDNIRQSWRWATENNLLSALADGIHGLARFYEISGLFQEGESLFEYTAAALRVKPLGDEPSNTDAAELIALRCRIQIEQASMLFAQGVLEQAASVASSAVTLARSLVDAASSESGKLGASDVEQATANSELEARARFELGRSLHKQGKHEAAPAEYEQALQLARTLRYPHLEANILRYWCWNCYDRGDFESALEYQAAAESLFKQLGDRLGLGTTLFDRAYIAFLQGDMQQARQSYERALADFRQIGDRRFECFSTWNLALIYKYEGRYSQALTLLDESLSLTRTMRDRHSEAKCLTNIAALLGGIGSYESAHSCLNQAQEINRLLEDPLIIAYWQLITADIFVAEDRVEEALPLAEGGLKLVREANFYELIVDCTQTCGRIHLALSNYEQAEALFKEAVAKLTASDDHLRLLVPLASLAQIYQAMGNPDQAMTHVNRILDTLTIASADELNDLLFVYLAVYEVLVANSDPRAQDILTAGYARLQEAASLIEDKEQRQSFLVRVPTNRVLSELGG